MAWQVLTGILQWPGVQSRADNALVPVRPAVRAVMAANVQGKAHVQQQRRTMSCGPGTHLAQLGCARSSFEACLLGAK